MQEGEIGERMEVKRGHSVRRKLFQDDDDDDDDDEQVWDRKEICAKMKENEINREREYEVEENRRNLAEAERRWNFNFAKEEPLPGRWEWTKVGDERNTLGSMNNEGNNDEKDCDMQDQREKSETEANEKTIEVDN